MLTIGTAECLGSQWQRDAALGAAIKKSVWQNVGQTPRYSACMTVRLLPYADSADWLPRHAGGLAPRHAGGLAPASRSR